MYKMPRKYSKARTARRTAKPSVARAKKVLQKRNHKLKKSNLDTFSLTCKSQAMITPTQGATVANYIYTTVPLMNASLGLAVTQNAEFKLYANMYDQVRINSVLVRVTPRANVFDITNGNLETLTQTGTNMVHTIIDRDGSPNANVQIFSRAPSYKKYSALKPFTRKYGIKWPTGVWLDAQNIYEDMNLLKQVGALGGIYIYAEDLIEDALEVFNEPWGDIQVYWNVVFRGKSQGTLSYNAETGAVSVLAHDSLPITLPSPLTNFKGTISDEYVVRNMDNDPDAAVEPIATNDTQNEGPD